ncbi:tetratricopeptide repeat protein [Pseudomonas putida]
MLRYPLLLTLAMTTLCGCAGGPRQHFDKPAPAPLAVRTDAEGALKLARLLRDNGRMAAAYGVYARAEERGQLSPAQSLEYAQVASNVLSAQDALPLYVRARQRLGDSHLDADQRYNLCLGIGRGQLAQSLWDDARQSLDCALQARPNDSEALNGLAVSESAQGHADKAEALLQQALKADPGSVAALNNLALARLANGQVAAAISLLEGANLNGQPTLVLNLALAYLLRNDEAAARQALQQHLPQVRNEPLLASLKASAARIQGGQPAARELLAASRQALPLDTLQ